MISGDYYMEAPVQNSRENLGTQFNENEINEVEEIQVDEKSLSDDDSKTFKNNMENIVNKLKNDSDDLMRDAKNIRSKEKSKLKICNVVLRVGALTFTVFTMAFLAAAILFPPSGFAIASVGIFICIISALAAAVLFNRLAAQTEKIINMK